MLTQLLILHDVWDIAHEQCLNVVVLSFLSLSINSQRGPIEHKPIHLHSLLHTTLFLEQNIRILSTLMIAELLALHGHRPRHLLVLGGEAAEPDLLDFVRLEE